MEISFQSEKRLRDIQDDHPAILRNRMTIFWTFLTVCYPQIEPRCRTSGMRRLPPVRFMFLERTGSLGRGEQTVGYRDGVTENSLSQCSHSWQGVELFR